MSPDLLFALTLAVKTSVTGAFVVIASMVAERAGPLIGAMVSTLPISAGPAYAFLALDHDTAFIAQGALESLAVNAATTTYALMYAVLAQRQPLVVSVPVALGVWLLLVVVIEQLHWNLLGAAVLNTAAFLVCIPLGRRFQHVKMPPARRRWYDVPLRAGMVACLVAVVVGLSSRVGPAVSGILAVFPIVLTSVMLILQPRVGGPGAAAVIANTGWGLVGFGCALATLHLTVVPLGAPLALLLALMVSIGWNAIIVLLRRRNALQAKG